MADLEVFIDFKSPYAFIAKDPTYQLETDYNIEIEWHPLTLNIGSYLGTAKKSEGRVVESNRSANQWLSVKYAYKDTRRYAELRGLTLRGTQKIWDTSLAGTAMLWVKQTDASKFKQFLDIGFERFWKRELDLEDEAVVSALVSECGLDGAAFLGWQRSEGKAQHDELQKQFLEEGVYGVPTYRINGHTYFGREHLPRVRWHLEGEKGPMPDISNNTRLAEESR